MFFVFVLNFSLTSMIARVFCFVSMLIIKCSCLILFFRNKARNKHLYEVLIDVNGVSLVSTIHMFIYFVNSLFMLICLCCCLVKIVAFE